MCDQMSCYADYVYPESVLGLGCAIQVDQSSCDAYSLDPVDTTEWEVLLGCVDYGNVTLGGDVEDVCVWSDTSCAMDTSAYDIEACSEMELTCMWDATCETVGCTMDPDLFCIPTGSDVCDLMDCYANYLYPESILGLGCAIQSHQDACEAVTFTPIDTESWDALVGCGEYAQED